MMLLGSGDHCQDQGFAFFSSTFFTLHSNILACEPELHLERGGAGIMDQEMNKVQYVISEANLTVCWNLLLSKGM